MGQLWSLKFLKEKKDVEAANVACSSGVPDQGSAYTGNWDYYHYCYPWKGHSGALHRCKQAYQNSESRKKWVMGEGSWGTIVVQLQARITIWLLAWALTTGSSSCGGKNDGGRSKADQWGNVLGTFSPKSLGRMATKTTKKIKAPWAKVSSHLSPGTIMTLVIDTEAQRILNHKMTAKQKLQVCPHGKLISVGVWERQAYLSTTIWFSDPTGKNGHDMPANRN